MKLTRLLLEIYSALCNECFNDLMLREFSFIYQVEGLIILETSWLIYKLFKY